MHPRLRAICDLTVPSAREYVGLHTYDGQLQDLSDAALQAGAARLGGQAVADEHDEAQLAAVEAGLRLRYGELAEHRWNPLVHLANLELACYDREYAPEEERAEAKRRHLAGWPDAIDTAVATLDRVPAAVAEGLLGAIKGLTADLDPRADEVTAAAVAAHERLVAHIRDAAGTGDPDPSLGADLLQRLLATAEAVDVDLGRLAERADAERDRLTGLLRECCAHLRPGMNLEEAVASLQSDHPTIDGVLGEARGLTQEVLAWTRASGLVPDHDGECLVGPAPPSRSWAMAMMSPAAPYESDAPSWYHVTPPDPAWPAEAQQEWLTTFSRTSLPAITVHEVAPGHFTHFRLLRGLDSDVRRTVFSDAFVEGWAHYVEELLVEEGFRDGDPQYAAGMAIEALVRVTRLSVSLGVHTGGMTMDEAVRRFERDAFFQGSAARSEAARATFDPTYGRYTWGKLAILVARDRAKAAWGGAYTHRRFHTALLALGAPPLGLLDTAIERG